MAHLPKFSPFLEEDFNEMMDLAEEHVSETDSDEEERAVGVEGVEEKTEKKTKSKRKRRQAGDRSGRQMVLRKINEEKKMRKNEEVISETSLELPRFAEAIAEARCDGGNSVLTNVFKVALLPRTIFNKAVRICQLYEDGELVPPSSSKQRMRKQLSGSSFSFLKGFDPLKNEDQCKIDNMLTSWLATNIRPGEKQGAVEKDGASPCLEAADGKKIIERLHREIKLLEKDLSAERLKLEQFQREVVILKERLSLPEDTPPEETPLEEISEVEPNQRKGQQSSETEDAAPPVKKPKYRGWAFVHEKNFVQKNIFEDTIVDSRLRKRN
ncbi:hypothetical protein AWC38_SpisGene15462 [Stylophora pistillata]|uniref:Uncharacterized protein n=1 Tax=Stylophora pistillata TaxID=50429 RepID=A0A2B4RV36_STYPI|nr:hypothetical protein AWC38_SpisGene15462 [Stylophora pistillata]